MQNDKTELLLNSLERTSLSRTPYHLFLLRIAQDYFIRNANHVICISNYAKSELLAYHQCDQNKISVIPNELNTSVSSKYFVWVGNSKPHKGLDVILNIFSDLKYDIVLIGVKLQKRCLPNNIYSITNVPDSIYNSLIKGSIGLVVTSKDEGFHLPTLQAINLNQNVFALDIPVLNELYGTKINIYANVNKLKVALKNHASNS